MENNATPAFQEYQNHLKKLTDAALEAANPVIGVEQHIENICERCALANHCWVVGAGKASLEMALALNEGLGGRLSGGAIAVVPERLQQLEQETVAALPFQLYPASHPLPTAQNITAAKAIAEVAKQAEEGDIVLLMLSGGGSAHLALPIEGLDLPAYQQLTSGLMKAGAAIQELNAVRKHAEQLKGGGLLRLAYPANVYALILSDVMGDSLAVIASGPVSADPSTFADADAVLKKFKVEVPPALADHLAAGMRGERPETLKEVDPLLEHVDPAIIGSNLLAVKAIENTAKQLGFSVALVETGVEGEAREVGARLADVARELKNKGDLPAIAILGGETTVTVRGNGLGGRNQELALAAAMAIDGMQNVAVMSLATDGIDGPTDAAGAFADGKTIQQAKEAGHNPRAYLENNDSYSLFKQTGNLILTGPTGTNVNDCTVVLVYS